MTTAEQPPASDRSAYDKVLFWYDRAKAEEWQISDLPWEDVPPIPEPRPGTSPDKKARAKDVWRSVISQQLQADELAVQMSAQLLGAAPDPEAKLYYSTMVQDESRHTEAWMKLMTEVGEPTDRDPYLDRLVRTVLMADTVEEKVFTMQVFYERAIISRFKLIEHASRGTVLSALCERLKTDDGIHHGAGMAYETVLLDNATTQTKRKVEKIARSLLPVFVKHALWRPPERSMVAGSMDKLDRKWVQDEVSHGIRKAAELGLELSDVTISFP